MRTPAFAQASLEPCPNCAPFDCDNPAFCQQPQPCRSLCTQRINLHCFCGPLVAFNLNGFNLPPICTSDADCQSQTGPGSVCINMNPNCDAVENKGCSGPCPGGRVSPRRGMRVRQA